MFYYPLYQIPLALSDRNFAKKMKIEKLCKANKDLLAKQAPKKFINHNEVSKKIGFCINPSRFRSPRIVFSYLALTSGDKL